MKASWCDTCRPTGTRCAPCDARRVLKNAARRRSYERAKDDPEKMATHRQRSKDGMRALYVERWAKQQTTDGAARTRALTEAQTEAIMTEHQRYSIPRCENCPRVGRPCPPCRNQHRRAKYLEEVGALTRKPVPRCEKCPPEGAPCEPCFKAWDRARRAAKMADPEYAARRKAQLAKSDQRRKAKRKAEGKPARLGSRKAPSGAPKGKPRTIPRCEACPPIGRPCRECYNANKRRSRGGTGEKLAQVRPVANLAAVVHVKAERKPRTKVERAEAQAAVQASVTSMLASERPRCLVHLSILRGGVCRMCAG